MTIQDFSEDILKIGSHDFETSIGTSVGLNSTKSAALNELRSSAIQFARRYRLGDDAVQLQPARGDLTAKLLVAQTVGLISEAHADQLLGSLQQLINERKK